MIQEDSMTLLVVVARGGRFTAQTVADHWSHPDEVLWGQDTNAPAALAEADSRHLRLVVVATGEDTGPGHRVCPSIRELTSAPLCLATPTAREADELLAFAHGCDEYVSLASGEVLRARLRALAARGRTQSDESTLEFGGLQLDPHLRTATVWGTAVALTRIEFDLLRALLGEQRRIIPRRELLEVAWGGHERRDHVLDVHMSRLRTKIMRAGGPKVGEPVPGIGYRVGIALAAPAAELAQLVSAAT
jgi:DNA-binding response OmpR family regulator